jgi:hypothetical protein
MNENANGSVVPLTEEIFFKHLRKGPIRNHFAENAGVLMKQMRSLCSPSEPRACTYGFVIPDLSPEECQAVRALLSPLKIIAEINLLGRVALDDNTVAGYVHITLRSVSRPRARASKQRA